MSTKITNLPKCMVQIEGEIETDIFASHETEAIKRLSKDLEIPGFRKGEAPEGVAKKNIPDAKILEEMATLAIGVEYPKILESEKIDAIGRPEITLTKLARGNPLG